jgi:SAM-dependent methyltransferase
MASIDLVTIKHIISNARLRKDIKSLKAAKKCYIYYAWKVIEELDLVNFISAPRQLNMISDFANVKDKRFLETLLDILVGAKYLIYCDQKYSLKRKPTFSIDKELKHLEKHCPGSTEWTHWLRLKSKKTLLSGNKVSESSFDEAKGILLWEKIMKESPYTLRQITINTLKKNISTGDKIADIGCGGGIGLEEILLSTDFPINLYGIEVSKKYLLKAESRIKKLSKEFVGLKKENMHRTKFATHNFITSAMKEKFDGAFLSLVVNHIDANEHLVFFQNIKKSMKKGSILVTLQFLNKSKFNRSPMWVMHNIPSHKDFPYKKDFVNTLKQVFPKVKLLFGGVIIICEL